MLHRRSAASAASAARNRFSRTTRRIPVAFIFVGCLACLGLIWVLALSNFMPRNKNNIKISIPTDNNNIDHDSSIHAHPLLRKFNNGHDIFKDSPSPPDDTHEQESPTKLIENPEQKQARLMIELDRCEWMKELLKTGKHIGKALPVPGKARAGGSMFWLKRPLMHTVNPETNEEIMLLRYNVYVKHQHTNKWTNTVDVLTKHQGNRLFPKLHGFCRDLDGFHSLAVEYLSFDMPALPIPGTLEKCVDRAQAALTLFSELDEMGLALVDFKKGQWMARKDNTLVLQDIDDIVQVPATSEYTDQTDMFERVIGNHHHLSKLDMNKKWGTTIFPNDLLTIRYDIFGTGTLLGDLGFQWTARDCAGYDKAFSECKKKLTDWSMTIDDDWPAPSQLIQAIGGCLKDRSFIRTERKEKPWHVVKVVEERDYDVKSACVKPYDKKVGVGGGGKVTRCNHSCCRAKTGYGSCYYTVKAMGGDSC